MNPDNMIAGGLMDDFDGTITKVRLVPWDYNGKLQNHVLAAAVTIKPEDGDEFVQHYSAGDLENFVPSNDGENGVDLSGDDPEAMEGIYALRVGKKEGLSSSSNWAGFIKAALDAGFPVSALTAAVSCFEGVVAHFNRIPQKKRAGLVKPAEADGQKARSNDILVITEIKSGPTTAGTKPAAGSKPTAPATSASSKPSTAAPKTAAATPAAPAAGDLDSKLVEIVRAAIKGQEDGITKDKLPSAALKGLSGAEKGKGVKRIVDPEFLNGYEQFWAFDAESGLIISVE